MALNNNALICFDFETGGLDPNSCELLELSAVVINPVTLNVDKLDKFHTYLKPKDWSNVTEESLAINKISKEVVDKEGVELNVGWFNFVNWVYKHNYEENRFTRPNACGHNIFNFDLPIIERLSRIYGNLDEEGKSSLFHTRDRYDLINLCTLWFCRSANPKNYRLDTLRDYFGLSTEGSHSAKVDVEQTAYIISRFMKLHRRIVKAIDLENLLTGKSNAN